MKRKYKHLAMNLETYFFGNRFQGRCFPKKLFAQTPFLNKFAESRIVINLAVKDWIYLI